MTRALTIVLTVSLLFTRSAIAQDGRREAQRMHLAAGEAAAEGRFAEARELLEGALEHYANVNTALNLAEILRRMGELVASQQTLAAIGRGAYGEVSGAQEGQLRALGAEIEGDLAHVNIRMSDPPESLELRIDGNRRSLDEGRIALDPGEHTLTVVAPLRLPYEARFRATRGETTVVEVELELAPEARFGTLIVEAAASNAIVGIVGGGRDTGHIERQLEPGTYEVFVTDGTHRATREVELRAGATLRIYDLGARSSSRPWIWAGVGVGVAAGLAVGGYFLFRPDVADPIQDPYYNNAGSVIQTLRY